MAAPAFGFSLGDFVTAIGLIRQVSKAIKDPGGAADDYRLLALELDHLQLVLQQLQDLRPTSSSSLNHYNAVCGMARTVEAPLQAFLNRIKKYDSVLGTGTENIGWRGVRRKVQWSVGMQEEVVNLRSIMTMKIVTLYC